MDVLPFCPIFPNIIVISFLNYTFNTGHTILCTMGISALTTVLRNIENSLRNWRKPIENKNSCIMFFDKISKHTQYFRKQIFAIGWHFLLKIKLNLKKKNLNFFVLNLFLFFAWFFNVFLPISAWASNISCNRFQRWNSHLTRQNNMQLIVCSALKV